MLSWLADRWQRRASRLRLARGRRGRILAVKWGYNPNSSSLGVDVTFLLFGMLGVALLTPLVAMLLRLRARPPAIAAVEPGAADPIPAGSAGPAAALPSPRGGS